MTLSPITHIADWHAYGNGLADNAARGEPSWICGDGWTQSTRTGTFYRTRGDGLIHGPPMFRPLTHGKPWWKIGVDEKALHDYATQFALEGPQ